MNYRKEKWRTGVLLTKALISCATGLYPYFSQMERAET